MGLPFPHSSCCLKLRQLPALDAPSSIQATKYRCGTGQKDRPQTWLAPEGICDLKCLNSPLGAMFSPSFILLTFSSLLR